MTLGGNIASGEFAHYRFQYRFQTTGESYNLERKIGSPTIGREKPGAAAGFEGALKGLQLAEKASAEIHDGLVAG